MTVTTIYLVPQWFFGIDIALHLVFALVAGIVSYYAFKIYKISSQRESELLGVGFLLICLSYIIASLLNWFVLSEAKEGYMEMSFAKMTLIGTLGIYIHMILFMAGLITLIYMTDKVRGERLYSLLLIVSTILLFTSSSPVLAFEIVSSLFAIYVFGYYIGEYRKNNNSKTLLIAGAFSLLLSSQLVPLISRNAQYAYVSSHLLEFGSYCLLAATLYLMLRGRKKHE